MNSYTPTENKAQEVNKRINKNICEYCHEHGTEDNEIGFVPQYDSVICNDCYEDNFGI